MPPVMNLGTVFPWEVQEAIAEDLMEVATQWRWVNTNPLFTRLPSYPCGQIEFTVQGTTNRPATVQLTAAIDAAATVLPLADVSYLMNGDTLELTFADGTVEMMEITGDPNEAASTVPVKRGDAFTVAGAAPINTQLRIISNSRTGGEELQKGIAPRHWTQKNWIQSSMHPVEVAGVTMDTANYRTGSISPGAATPLDAYRMRALGDMTDGFDRMILYQRGVAPSDTDTKRTKTKGVRQQCQDAGSYIFRPQNYAAYSPYDFFRDLHAGPAEVGGSPNLYFMSTDWVGGLMRWKFPLVQIDMGTTVFEVTIEGFTSEMAPGGIFIKHPKMKAGSIFACNSADLFLRHMRKPFWKPRGSLGDTYKGDLISRFGVQLNSAEQARFIEGIQGFAPAT
jgi:hypothetical protein